MSLIELDQQLECVIREFTLRIVVPRWNEFETLWEAALRVCERYELGKPRPVVSAIAHESSPGAKQSTTSSAEPSAVDAPVQTHPPIAA
jgi:hypothetical protein